MDNGIAKIKRHFKKHKVGYACGVTAVTTAGITALIMKGRYEAAITGAYGSKTIDNSVTMRPFLFFSKEQ